MKTNNTDNKGFFSLLHKAILPNEPKDDKRPEQESSEEYNDRKTRLGSSGDTSEKQSDTSHSETA